MGFRGLLFQLSTLLSASVCVHDFMLRGNTFGAALEAAQVVEVLPARKATSSKLHTQYYPQDTPPKKKKKKEAKQEVITLIQHTTSSKRHPEKDDPLNEGEPPPNLGCPFSDPAKSDNHFERVKYRKPTFHQSEQI